MIIFGHGVRWIWKETLVIFSTNSMTLGQRTFLSFRYKIYKSGKKLIPISVGYCKSKQMLTMLKTVLPYEKISVSIAIIIFVTVLLPIISFIEQI